MTIRPSSIMQVYSGVQVAVPAQFLSQLTLIGLRCIVLRGSTAVTCLDNFPFPKRLENLTPISRGKAHTFTEQILSL